MRNRKQTAGTRIVSWILFRQNGLWIFIWLFSLIGFSAAAALAYKNIYTSEKDIMGFALTMKNPAMIALLGPGYALEDYHVAAVFSNEMLLLSGIAVAIMNILLAIRLTKIDEEEGRLEIVQALPVGKLAYLFAAVIQLILVNALLAVLMGAALSALRIPSMSVASSFLYGTALGSTGIFFAAGTVLFAQLADTSRGTAQSAFSSLLFFYILRSWGDVKENYLSNFSPLGMMQKTGPFVQNQWRPVLVLLFGTLLLLSLTFYFNTIRDMGSGLLPSRRGRNRSSLFLQSPIHLFWRLERVSVFVWLAGIFLMSAVFGAVLQDMEQYFAEFEFLQQFLPSSTGLNVTEQFLILLLVILSIFSAIPTVSVLYRPLKEEKQERLSQLLSKPVSRCRVLGSSYLLALIIGIIMQTAIVAGMYLSMAEQVRESLNWQNLVEAAAWYILALWFVESLAVFLAGRFPQAISLIWAYILWVFLVTYLGELLEFPDWLKSTSVFYVIPILPFDRYEEIKIGFYAAASLLLTSAGFWYYRQRDLEL